MAEEDAKGSVDPAPSMAHHARAMKMAAQAATNGGRKESRCQVPDCETSITTSYHARHKVCPAHAKAAEVEIRGQKMRFCQQCSKMHALEEFEGKLRSCKKTLSKHNQRRKMGSVKVPAVSSSSVKRPAASPLSNSETKKSKELVVPVPSWPTTVKATSSAPPEKQMMPTMAFTAFQRDGSEAKPAPSTQPFHLASHLLHSHPMYHHLDMHHAALEIANSYLPSAESCENIRLGMTRSATPPQVFGSSEWGERLGLGIQGVAPHLLVPTFSGEYGGLPLQFSQLAAQLHSSFSGAFGQTDPNHMQQPQ